MSSPLILALTLVGLVGEAAAQTFTFNPGDTTIPPGTGQKIIDAYYPALGAVPGAGTSIETTMQPRINALATDLQGQIEGKLNRLQFGPFMGHTATAQAAAARGSGVDHASFIKLFSLTAMGSAAVTGFDDLSRLRHPGQLADRIENGTAPTSGVAPGVGGMLGFNFGALNLRKFRFFDPNRLQLYASAMYVKLDVDGGDVRARAGNYGGHAKYQLFLPRALTHNSLVRWGGLNVATGVTYASTAMNFHVSLPSGSVTNTVPVAIGTVREDLTLLGTWQGDANLDAKLRAYTVPLEVSSFLQLLYVFTLFGGIGMDLNFGSAKVAASARAPLTITASSPSKPNQSVTVLTPKPSLSYSIKKAPTHVDGRAFLGLQLNAGVLAVYAQGMVDTSKTLMANVGLRAFY